METGAGRADARGMLANLAPTEPVEVRGRGELRTDRLVLRTMAPSDRDEFLRVIRLSREHLRRFSPLHQRDESDTSLFERQVELAAEGDASGKGWRRVMFLPEGRLVGGVNLNSIRRGLTCEADANWWVGADVCGRGYATEAIVAMLTHAFADLPQGLGLHRVLAGIQGRNEPSRRLARRLGFARLGPERSFLHAGGKWELHEMYAVSPDSFRRESRAA